ncbi:MAG TPA: hypothetical protein ENG63_06320, partial [Candidatus Desulfofervidus auxilii]|nr:hypothetical protein [Candidatus Desulfofervidus auxilii]
DRLYFFNGDLRHLYRYYYSYKQFVQVGLDTSHYSINHPINKLRNSKLFLVSPIEATVCEDRLFIFGYYPYTEKLGGGPCNLAIDMETKEVIDLTDADPYHNLNVHYLTPISKIELISTNPDTNLSHYFLNFSPLFPYTKNQIPHPDGCGEDIANVGYPTKYSNACICEIDNKPKYIDRYGMFEISNWYEEELHGKPFSKITDSTTITPDQIAEINEILDSTSLVAIPRFQYSLQSLNYGDEVKLPIRFVWTSKGRIYIVGDDGNILRINPNDGTMFKYFSQLWEGSSIGMWDNIVYCFGGKFGGWKPYTQNGLPCPTTGTDGEQILTHNGFLKFDLNYNEFCINYLQTIPDNLTRIDYDIIRDYLTDLSQDFLTSDLDKQTLQDVKDQLYLKTQNIIADLSRRILAYETGNRPSDRAYACSCQIDNKLYILGGIHITIPPLAECPVYSVLGDFYCYDMEEQRWIQLASAPFTICYGSLVYDGNDRIFLIGGFKSFGPALDYEDHNNEIWYYKISTNTWHKYYYVPATYRGRGKATCYRINDKIIIIYGCQAIFASSGEDCPQEVDFPVDDIWILDLTKEIMYQVITAYPNEGLIVQNNLDPDDRYFQILPSRPYLYDTKSIFGMSNLALRLYTFDIVNKTFDYVSIIPDQETRWTFNIGSIDEGTGEWKPSINYPTRYLGAFYHKNRLYIVGSYKPSAGSEKEYFRLFYVNEYNQLKQIVIDFPLLKSPKVVVYDNNKYLYCFWNAYNIWRLDMDNLGDPNAWLRLPPNPDIEKDWIVIEYAFWLDDSNEIVFCSKGGTVLKFNPETNGWILIKEESWSEAEKAQDIAISENTLYYFKEKSLFGRYFDINLRQFDNFYFNLLKLRFKEFKFVEYDYLPALIKRHRLLVSNWCGHINYAWIKIVGNFDLYFDLNEYTRCHEIRVYGDDYVLNNPDNCKLIIRTKNGFQTLLNPDTIINDPEWEFDSEFFRRYRKWDFNLNDYIYTIKPPNYLKFEIPDAIKEFEVIYKPEFSESNYIAHINAIECHNINPYLVFTQNGNQIFSITIEPFETEESAVYTVTVTNSGPTMVYDVKTYIFENKQKILFSKYGTEWKFADIDDPLELVDQLYPGNSVSFLIKAKKFDEIIPLKLELVVTGKTTTQ